MANFEEFIRKRDNESGFHRMASKWPQTPSENYTRRGTNDQGKQKIQKHIAQFAQTNQTVIVTP